MKNNSINVTCFVDSGISLSMICRESRVQALEPFKAVPDYQKIFDNVRRIKMKYYPELKNQWVYLGIMNNLHKNDRADASVDVENNVIRFSVDSPITNVVISHELAHMVQHQDSECPKTEEYNSIESISRLEPVDMDSCAVAYVCDRVTIPKNDIPSACREALGYRKSGKRDYIKYLIKLLTANK